jgi:hypothetical protein
MSIQSKYLIPYSNVQIISLLILCMKKKVVIADAQVVLKPTASIVCLCD